VRNPGEPEFAHPDFDDLAMHDGEIDIAILLREGPAGQGCGFCFGECAADELLHAIVGGFGSRDIVPVDFPVDGFLHFRSFMGERSGE